MTIKRIFTYVTFATAFLVIGMSPFLLLSGIGSSASLDGGVVIVLGVVAFGVILGGVLAWAAYLDKKEGVVSGENESAEEELREYLVTKSDEHDGPQRTKRRWAGLIAAGYWFAVLFTAVAYWLF